MFAPAKSRPASNGAGSGGGGAGASSSGQQARRAQPTKSFSSKVSSPPTTLEINGTTIHFPFQPYDCQVDYMSTALTSLHRGENALLESPTGTGKTLCLLCSALAWQRGQAAARVAAASASMGGSQLSQKPSSSQQDVGAGAGVQQQETSQRRAHVILYATRTHSQLSQVVREMRSTRYRPRYAVLGSREQLCVHPKVKTKTATSSDINAGCNRLNKERKCRFRNNLDGFRVPDNESAGACGGSIGGGGGQSSSSSTNFATHQPIMDMEELLTLGTERKICPFYLTRNDLPSAEIIFLPYNYLLDPDTRSNTLAEVNWSDAVIIFDEAHNIESFASDSASFDLTGIDLGGCVGEVQRAIGYVQATPEMESAISLDNMIRLKALLLRFESYLDSELPSSGGSYTGEYIFHIMKEGMNVTHSNHAQFLAMVRKVSDFILDVRGGSVGGKTSGATPKLDHLVSSLKKVFGSGTQMQAIARAGGYRVNITPSSSPGSGRSPRTLSYWCLTPSLSLIDLKALHVRSILVTSGTLSPLPSYALELGLPFPNRLENPHIISQKQIHVRIISKGVSGKHLCSNYGRRDDPDYIVELGNTLASLARVVPDGMLVFFPSYGVMNGCVAGWGGPRRAGNYGGGGGGDRPGSGGGRGFFAPRRRSGGAGAGAAANSDRFSFPHCPDYYGSGGAGAGGTNKTPWSRLLATKSIVLEPRSTSNLPAAIAEYKKFLSRPKSTGAILMGVCRGKISEGIDFADNMCRAVVITGLPFPPYKDDKVRLKREYLDSVKANRAIKNENAGFDYSPEELGIIAKDEKQQQPHHQKEPESLSGAAWYDQQAHRAVNQAVGRTIRHRNDYGAILLLDSRFADARNRKGLSKWVRPYIKDDQGMGKNVGELGRFFKGAREMKERERAEATGSAGRLQLKYEEEGDANAKDQEEDEAITRIAVVRTENAEADGDSNKGSANDDLMRGYVRPDLVLTRMDLKDREKDASAGGDNEMNTSSGHDESSKADPTGISAGGLQSLYATSKQIPRQSAHEKQQMGNESAFSALASMPSSSRNPYQGSRPSSARGAGSKRKLPDDSDEMNKPRDLSSISSRPKSAPAATNGSSSANGARKFFDAARASLSVDDFSTVRSALVRMKQHGDKEDKKSYLEAAEDLIQVLNRYDASLLDLFYPLLPSKLAPSVIKIAASSIFHSSRFKREAKEALSQDEFDMVTASVVPLIASSQAGREDKRKYLRDVEHILKVLIKHPSSALVASFVNLVPARQKQPVQALAQQIRRVEEKKKIKQAERQRLGEASIKVENFRRSTSSAGTNANSSSKLKAEEAADPAQLEAQREMEGALLAAQQARNAARDRLREKLKAEAKVGRGKAAPMASSASKPVASGSQPKPAIAVRNPYASRPSSSSSSTCAPKASSRGQTGATKGFRDRTSAIGGGSKKVEIMAGPAAGAPTSLDSTHRVSKRARSMLQHGGKSGSGEDQRKSKAEKSKQLDALDQCLQQVKADVYTKDAVRRQPLGKFKQNIPKGLDCRLCEESMKDPFVSDCNHSACSLCWSKWLKSHATCPVCRAPTTRESLSRMVFRDCTTGSSSGGQGGASGRQAEIPTLSQVVREVNASSSGSEDDEEDELEIVAG